jgi:hypothetical protein
VLEPLLFLVLVLVGVFLLGAANPARALSCESLVYTISRSQLDRSRVPQPIT